MIRRLQADPEWAQRIATAGQERMAEMDTDEVANYCYQMLKGYAALQRFKPKRDPRSWEMNCEDDMVRHYDRGSMLGGRYLVGDNSTCLRPPPAAGPFKAPSYGGSWNGTHPRVCPRDLSGRRMESVRPARVCILRLGDLMADWDTPEAYKGGALPDWTDADPAMTGKPARVIPYGKTEGVTSRAYYYLYQKQLYRYTRPSHSLSPHGATPSARRGCSRSSTAAFLHPCPLPYAPASRPHAPPASLYARRASQRSRHPSA